MKQILKPVILLCLLVIVATGSTLTFAQGTHVGDLVLTTQAQVDAFNYTEVTGDLEITGADIDDLSSMSGLTTIGDMLNIWNNPLLETIDSFDALSSVGGTILIDANNAMTTFEGFGALQDIGGALYFYNNLNLVTIDAFHNLETTGDNIDFWYQDALETISGFESLTSVGWSLEIGGNPKLTKIPAFKSLETINSSLFIIENNLLPGITGFQNLQHVDYSFNVFLNPMVDTLCGFYNYFSDNNPYAGDGFYVVEDNHPSMTNPTSIQDILDDGPCPGEAVAVPTMGQWSLYLLILMLMLATWRHQAVRVRLER